MVHSAMRIKATSLFSPAVFLFFQPYTSPEAIFSHFGQHVVIYIFNFGFSLSVKDVNEFDRPYSQKQN